MDIAIVDDEKVIREYLCELVENQRPGSHVEVFATGEELLAKAVKEAGKKVEIHTDRNKESIEIYATMEELEGQLG